MLTIQNTKLPRTGANPHQYTDKMIPADICPRCHQQAVMSLVGHLRRFLLVQAKSALRPITTRKRTFSDVRKVLKADIADGRIRGAVVGGKESALILQVALPAAAPKLCR
jgi:hypothetical protein